MNILKNLNLIYNQQNNFKYSYKTKYIVNYHFLINNGLALGSHIKNINIRNTSIIYAIRNNFCILTIQKTLYELIKILKIIETISFKRGVIYFINSYISFKIVMNSFYKYPNHYYIYNKKKKLEYIYLISNWKAGFLTNNNVYFNALKRKIKFPRLPHFGFNMDQNLNINSINEFNKVLIPFSSVIDSSSTQLHQNLYTIISNGKSIESTFFYLFNLTNSFYIGYYNEKLKFKIKHRVNLFINIKFFKKIFLKNFILINKLTLLA